VGLNHRPTVYETVALPLSYIGFQYCKYSVLLLFPQPLLSRLHTQFVGMFISAMKLNTPSPIKRKADVEWVKTPYPNLIRYKPSGNYFGRVRVNGKLIRRSLETHVLTVAKLTLSDFLQDHRRLGVNKGESVLGEIIIEMFKRERQHSIP
jgi:hypothetical protein